MADLHGGEMGAGGADLGAEISVHAQNLGGFGAGVKEVAQNLHVHRRSSADIRAGMVGVFGRHGRVGHEPSVHRLLDQRVQKELCCAL